MSEYCSVCECDPCDCHGQTEDYVTKEMKYAYVKKGEYYYVPRAPSFCQARERNNLFESKMGVEPLIVGLAEWNMLTLTEKVEYLVCNTN